MSNEIRIKACMMRHPDWSPGHVADSMSVRREEVRAVIGNTPQVVDSLVLEGNVKEMGTVDLSSVIKRYDIKAAILNELSALPEGKLISEAELCNRTSGTDKNRFRRTVENNPDIFNPLRIKLKLDAASDGKYFWGRASDIGAALKIRDL